VGLLASLNPRVEIRLGSENLAIRFSLLDRSGAPDGHGSEKIGAIGSASLYGQTK